MTRSTYGKKTESPNFYKSTIFAILQIKSVTYFYENLIFQMNLQFWATNPLKMLRLLENYRYSM